MHLQSARGGLLAHAPSGSRNQVRCRIGKKYMAFSKLLAPSTTITQSAPAATLPVPRYHLLTKPAIGGTPIMPKAHRKRGHGPWHASAHAVHFTDLMHTDGFRQIARTEKSVIFIEPWCYPVDDAPDGGDRSKDSAPRAM